MSSYSKLDFYMVNTVDDFKNFFEKEKLPIKKSERIFKEISENPEYHFNAHISDMDFLILKSQTKAFRIAKIESPKDELAALGENFASLIHDISTPLNTLSLSTSIMSMLLDSGKDIDFNEIKQQVQNMDLVINNLNPVMEAVKLTYKKKSVAKTFNLNKLGDTVSTLMILAANNEKIDIVNKIDENMEINTDWATVFRVMTNLVKNSIEYLSQKHILLPEKWILMELKEDNPREDFLYLEISNGGSLVQKDKIFEIKEIEEEGSGMGLYGSKKNIQKIGGDLYLKEDTKYTTFCIKIPKNKKD